MGQADALMAAALRDWQANQRVAGVPDLTSGVAPDVARDVAEIRRQIFEAESRSAAWRTSFEWDRWAEPTFLVVNPHIIVQVAGGVPVRATVYPAAHAGNVLFMTTGAMTPLVNALNALATSDTSVTFVSGSREMADFLRRHLPAEMAMLGGLASFASIPNVQAATFDDEARTRARVGIRTASSGGVLLMEKTGGAWRVTGVGDTYVT